MSCSTNKLVQVTHKLIASMSAISCVYQFFELFISRLSEGFTNAAEVLWYGKTGASLFFRCNCTSTAFAPHKHGGEKGIHMRFQIDTFEMGNSKSIMCFSFWCNRNFYSTDERHAKTIFFHRSKVD